MVKDRRKIREAAYRQDLKEKEMSEVMTAFVVFGVAAIIGITVAVASSSLLAGLVVFGGAGFAFSLTRL